MFLLFIIVTTYVLRTNHHYNHQYSINPPLSVIDGERIYGANWQHPFGAAGFYLDAPSLNQMLHPGIGSIAILSW